MINDTNHKLEQIIQLYDDMGDLQYDGEPVTQLEHAWQCYLLAKEGGQSESLQCAAFLHDYGHLLSKRKDTPSLEGFDDRHEVFGANILSSIFPPSITEPIKLHVTAKRYLVTADEFYYDCLSEDSRRSLELQGGFMTQEEVIVFLENPFALQAVELRQYDDLAKRDERIADRAHVLSILRAICESCVND